MPPNSGRRRAVYIGFDAAEERSYRVALKSLQAHLSRPTGIHRLCLEDVMLAGLFKRPLLLKNGQTWDVFSQASTSTEHANARFLLPFLGREDWALFTDCDVLFRADIHALFDLADEKYAIMCVQHQMDDADGIKKGGLIQQPYARKNWSSVVLWNLRHPSHNALTLDAINLMPGRDLHRFWWLNDDEIGPLPCEWNHLVGISPPNDSPHLVHFTLGAPCVPGYEHCAFADEWRSYDQL